MRQDSKPLLVFDYDGTIHETMEIYRPAVCEAIRWLSAAHPELGLREALRGAMPEEGQFRRWIGMNAADMWRDFLPDMPPALRQEAIGRVGSNMEEMLIRPDKGRWYAGISEVLEKFHDEGYAMLVLSNCREAYAKTHWEKFRMERCFSAFLASESYQDLPKAEILRCLLDCPEEILDKAAAYPGKETAEKSGLSRLSARIAEIAMIDGEQTGGGVPGKHRIRAIVLGDRASDRDAAIENGLPFIGCAYGYGTEEELSGASCLAHSPGALPGAVENFILSHSFHNPIRKPAFSTGTADALFRK